MGRGARFSVALLLILMLGSGASSDGHGSGSLDLRTLERQSKDFLKSIELEHVGKKRRRGKSGTDDVEIPPWMLEEYRERTGSEPDTTHFNKPGSFTGPSNLMTTTQGRVTHKTEGPLNEETVVKFDFAMGDGQDFHAATLKAYWKSGLPSGFKRKSGSFMAYAYDLVRPNRDPDLQIANMHDVRRIAHRDPERDEGWVEFDVTGAVGRWIRKGLKTTHLLLRKGKMRARNCPERSIVPEGAFTEAYLVVYSEGRNAKSHRQKREQEHGGRKIREARQRSRKERRRERERRQRQPCRRHEMYVDFEHVGWTDWIVAPPGFSAYYCQGECRFPLPDHSNATNHAVVQTLVNGVHPSLVSPVQCCPTDLSPVSMLYINEFGKVTLKNYDDMVVEGCGCR